MNYFKFIQNNFSTIQGYFLTHFSLVIWSIIISLLLWVPVGVLISKNEKWAKIVLGISNTIFCIPSLALFAVLITVPFLGLGRRSALVALVLYAMMPLVRNVYQGIKIVDKSVIEAAKGMGMDAKEFFGKYSFPWLHPLSLQDLGQQWL